MQVGDAFLLLSLPRATLESRNGAPVTDSLYLECVTISAAHSPFADREVYLVIKLGYFEIPVDPVRTVTASIGHHSHLYTFSATDPDPEFSISIPFPSNSLASQDLQTFNHILTQYVTTFAEQRDGQHIPRNLDQKLDPLPPPAGSANEQEYEDLRGHLILVNESDGTVIGELDHDFKINEDPAVARGLPDDAPVVLELPPDYDAATAVPGAGFVPLTAREAFVHAVPPEERDVFTQTATLISHAISATTTLLVSGMSGASKFYVTRSKPHTPSSSPGPSTSRSGIVISNPRTRSALTQAHNVSGKAVKVSAKTIEVVDGLIRKAAGRNQKQKYPTLPPRSGGKSDFTPPPAYSESGPPLPPRPTLRKRDKVILSADVVISTIEESILRILDTSSEEITRVVTHTRGEESGHNAALATGTARNVALVYVDARGIGRKAIIRRFGREYVKGKLSSGNSNRPRLDQIVADHASQYGSSSNVPTTRPTSRPTPPPRHPHEKK